jgi:hypothetical protein
MACLVPKLQASGKEQAREEEVEDAVHDRFSLHHKRVGWLQLLLQTISREVHELPWRLFATGALPALQCEYIQLSALLLSEQLVLWTKEGAII